MYQLKETLKNDKYIFLFFIVFSALFLFFVSQCSPFYNFSESTDINIYFTIARGIVHGLTPYQDLFDHKGPLIFFIYSLGVLISESSFTGIYLLEIISLTVSLYIAFRCSTLFLDRKLAISATIIFGAFVLFILERGGTAEEFILPFWNIGLYFILRHYLTPSNKQNLSYALIHGVCIGCVFMIKFNLIIFWFIPLLAIIIHIFLNFSIIKAIKYMGNIILGILIVFTPIIIYFILNNALSDLWDGYISFNILYGTSFPPSMIVEYMVSKVPILHTRGFLILITSCFSIFIFVFKKNILNIFFNWSLILMYISTLILLFKAAFISYYVIVLCTIILLGIITIISIYRSLLINIPIYKLVIYSFILVTPFIYLSNRKIIKNHKKNNLVTIISKKINNENGESKNFHLLNIGLDYGYYMQTQTLPNCKYFHHPNISDSDYPEIGIEWERLISSSNAPEYLIRHRPAYIDTTINTESPLPSSIILQYYNVHETATADEGWPPGQAILYKRKDLK